VRALALLALGLIATERALAQETGVFNVRDPRFGAHGDGVADDTNAIQAALNEIGVRTRAGAPGSVLYFPPGIYRTTGNFDVSAFDGLNVVGAGPGVTTIRLAHATNDLFFIGLFNTQNQHYREFSVISDTIVRTDGWIFRGGIGTPLGAGALLHSRFSDIDIKDQVNGFWIPKYEFVWIDRVKMSTFVGEGGIGIKAGQPSAPNRPDNNQGSELAIRATSITGRDLSGRSLFLAPPRLAYGYVIQDVDAVYLTDSEATMTLKSGLWVTSSDNGHVPSNLFFDKVVFDSTRDDPAARFTGFRLFDVTITGCVFSNAGRMAGGSAQPGLSFESQLVGPLVISGSQFLNSRGHGLRMNPRVLPRGAGQSPPSIAISGAVLADNGGDGIHLNFTPGELAPVITGTNEVGSGGKGLRLSGGTNRIVVSGNRFVSGIDLGGVQAVVNSDNGQ
jgi:hypothetical protein